MAASAEEIHRVELGLNAIDAVLRDVRGIVAAWSSLSEDDRISWSLEWSNEMARLRHLADDDAAGRLSSAHRVRFRSLVERAWAERSSVEALGLTDLPDIPALRLSNVPRRAAG